MSNLYKQAAVDIDAGQRTVELMKKSIRATFASAVLAGSCTMPTLF